jgi:hypothetical protein
LKNLEMNKILKTTLLFLATGLYSAFSQSEAFTLVGKGVGTTFAKDYQALGINAANLGWGIDNGEKRIAFGTGETGFTASTKLFNNEMIKDVKTFPLNFDIKSGFNYNDFKEVSTDLQDGFTLNADLLMFGGAISVKGIGTFAISVKEKYQMDFGLSKDLAEIVTYGFGASYFDSLLVNKNNSIYQVENTPNNYDSLQSDTGSNIIAGTSSNSKTIAEIMAGSRMSISWLREYTVGFGRHLIKTEKGLNLYVGGALKYIQGMAIFDLEANPNKLEAFGAYSPSFDKGSGNGFISSGAFRFAFPKAAGSGFGVDLGANIDYNNKVKIGLAVNDIGAITWKENTFSALSDSLLTTFRLGGFSDDSVSQNGGGAESFDTIINSLLSIDYNQTKRTISLASTIRLGASIRLGKKIEIGADLVAPLNDNPGNLEKTIISFGGDVKLGPIILSSGAVFGGNYLTRVPFGIVFAPAGGKYEMGISTRDVLSLLQFKTIEKPILSASFGFARIKF